MENSKKIVVSVLIVILCFMFGLSIADTIETKKDIDYDYDKIMDHVEAFSAYGPHSIADKEENQAVMEYIISQLESYGIEEENTTERPAYQVQDFVTSMNKYQNFYLSNVIVHIPANSVTATNEAVMVMAHFDSVPMGNGVSDDATACAVMLESIRYYLDKMENGYTISNDMVFCFVNAEEYGLCGSQAFMEEFTGFEHLTERIRFGINLEARGTDGTQIMFETAANNYNTVKLFSKVNEDLVTCSVATMIYDMMPNGTDFSNFKEYYQGLNMANIGGGENYHTQNDDLEHVGAAYVTQQAKIVDDLLETLANYDLDTLYDADESAVFFSYLNVGTVVYNHAIVIVLAILGMVLLVLNVILSAKYRKEKNLLKTMKGILTIIVGLALTAGLTYGCYYLFQYISVLAGNLDLHAFGGVAYSNTAIVIGIGLVALGVIVFVSSLGCKFLKIESRDIVRAFAYIHVVLGIVLSFALADASYLFIFSGLLFMINELSITICKKIQLADYHFEILATAMYFPLIIPIIALATSALGLGMCYVFGVLFALSFFAAGANLKKPVFGGVFMGMAMMIFLIAALTTIDPHVNMLGKQSISMLSYDDALVYVVDDAGDSEYRIYDLNAYESIQKYAPAMEYGMKGCYEGIGEPKDIALSIVSETKDGSLAIQKADENSTVYLTFTNATARTFTVDDGISTRAYEFNENGVYSITIHSNCTVSLESGTAEVFYREVVIDYPELIPEEYDETERLHFNLWMIKDFVLEAK